MKTIEAGGKIHKGKLKLHNEKVFKQSIQDIGFVSHVHLTLEYGNKRTVDQNSYLFGGVVEPIRIVLRQNGYDFSAHECYKYLENRFSRKRKHNDVTNTKYWAVIPLKELDTDQFEKVVIGEIREWANQDLDIYIKLPHEYYEMTLDAYNQWKAKEITKKQAIELSEQQLVET